MTIQQLQYVVALDNHRHFVKAAESCYVAQPTLTLQVKKLEDEISIILFDRKCKPLEPTPAGRLFIERAKVILNEIVQLKGAINDERDNLEGTFKIGVIPTLLPNLLPLFINDFIKHNPKTKLTIDELQSEKIIELLKNKMIDIGILATPLDEQQIREIPLFYEEFVVYSNQYEVLPKDSVVSSDQLQPKGLWLLKKGHCFRNQTLNICQFGSSGKHRNIILEGGSIQTLKKIVKAMSGYTLIPELSYERGIDDPYIIQFKDPKPVREISLVVHKHFIKEALIDALRNSILNNIPQHLRKNGRFKPVRWR